MTTLVTGATGLVGSHVTRRLVERGDSVRALVREHGWRPAHHEDTLQTTIDWYREDAPAYLRAQGARQPLTLRAAGLGLRNAAGVLRSFSP